MLGIVEVNPLKTVPFMIHFVQGPLTLMEPIEIAHQPLQAYVRFELAEMPFETRVVIPFALLTEFSVHEQHFLSWMGMHVAVQRA